MIVDGWMMMMMMMAQFDGFVEFRSILVGWILLRRRMVGAIGGRRSRGGDGETGSGKGPMGVMKRRRRCGWQSDLLE